MSLFLFQPSSINEPSCLFSLPVVDDAPFSNRMCVHIYILRNEYRRREDDDDDIGEEEKEDEIERYNRVRRREKDSMV